ncbi:MAG: RluA family pseudouridine synthase [Tractidigestivibacter sp.]|jgi:23S rRNA pseudouridine1911/1915/1917 synthase|uniref:RluA family pseudouridine synthase n=1 Tax=Tractidigestivibacter sp. TaxID=2847320 RepID=UPI003D923C21
MPDMPALASDVTLSGREVRCTVAAPCSAQELALSLGMSRHSAAAAFARHELSLASGEPLLAAARLSAGDGVVIALAATSQSAPAPHVAPAKIVYRDPIFLAADKPAGQLVHGDGTGASTLTDAVCAALAAEGASAHPQAVQRLDVPTTGLVLFSLTEEFQPALDALVSGHGMKKRYLAEVTGSFKEDQLTIDEPIGRDRHDSSRMRVCRPGQGKPAVTRVKTLARKSGKSLLLVELGTGRRHQIRVHLAAAGHPILGDTLYGGARDSRGLMLHAYEESFLHPLTGEPIKICTEFPKRFESWHVQLQQG